MTYRYIPSSSPKRGSGVPGSRSVSMLRGSRRSAAWRRATLVAGEGLRLKAGQARVGRLRMYVSRASFREVAFRGLDTPCSRGSPTGRCSRSPPFSPPQL